MIFNYLIAVFICILISYILIHNRLVKHVPHKDDITSSVTPTSGGIGILIGFLSFYLITGIETVYPNFLISMLLIGLITIIGFLDDVYHIKNIYRFVGQIVICIYFLNQFNLDFILLLIALISSIYLINSYNFMDGIDMLATLQAISMLSIVIFLTDSYFQMNLLVLILSFSFLLFNFQPAKLFLGNAGSYFYGMFFVVLFNILYFYDNFSFFTICIIYTVFLVDTLYCIITRFVFKILSLHKSVHILKAFILSTKYLFSTRHVTHNYQKMTFQSNNHKQTCLYMILYNLILVTPLAYISHKYSDMAFICFILSLIPYIIWCMKNKAGILES
tara:strand:+ start:2673 stop:3668 length:996 start_codon:yes stop_codon:yes gene_type:complete